jgi:Protein kinase domain
VAKLPVIAGVVFVLAGAGAVGYAVTHKLEGGMPAAQSTAMASALAELDGAITTARGKVEQRAKTLSEVNTVINAVSTDADTAADMVGRELAFKPQEGEVIELGQIPKGATPVTLITLPPDGMRSSHDGKPGSYAELVGDHILVTEVVEVTPLDKDAALRLTGYVTVSRPLDLKASIATLASAGTNGYFQLGSAKLAIGDMKAAGAADVKPLHSQPDAKLVAIVPVIGGGLPMPILLGGAAGAGVGLLLLLVGVMMTGRKPGGAGSLPVDAHNAPTQLSAVSTSASSAGIPIDFPSGPTSVGPGNLGSGQALGRWEIIKRIGSGGMADVYLAQSRGEAGFEKLVALKVMHSHLARNDRAVEHFLDEARLAARVQHPNVVAIHDLGKIGTDYVIVMDYVDGVDLERLLASARAGNRPVPINVGLGIMCRICDGLEGAHKATAPDGTPLGIVHRDVKSANVLVSKQGAVKVVDFGIAKAAMQSHMTIAGETKGTPSMMAPEQRVGEQVDVRADVYSTAAVGFEVMTGHGVNLDLAALAHLGVENWPHLPLPSTLRPSLPKELDEVLLGAMSFEREKRPTSCATFEAQFEAIMKQYSLSATDKEIARWVESEIAQLPRAPEAPRNVVTKQGVT